MKKLKIGIMLLVLLPVGMVVVPAVSAATAPEGRTTGWNVRHHRG
jgi:hypothetical protein